MTLRASDPPSNHSGEIPLPEGEEEDGHAGTTGEASPSSLANHTAGGSDPRRVKVVRATTRIAIDITAKTIPDDAMRKALYQALYQARADCARAANACIRELWKRDEDALIAWRLENDGNPKGKDWRFPQVNLYALVRRVAPDLASGVAATVSYRTNAKWREMRYRALVTLEASPPRYRRDAAFPIREQSFRVRHVDGSDYDLAFSLAPGRHPGGAQFHIPIRARDNHMSLVLGSIASAEWKVGALTIEQDRRRKSRWYARIAYTRLEPLSSGVQVAAINRGIDTFLAGVVGAESWLYDGADIESYLRQTQARRRQFQRNLKASGRQGRGRKRALRPIGHLSGKAARWRQTKNQTIARNFVNWLCSRGVGVLYIEDLSGIRDGEPRNLEGGKATWQRIQEWPYFELGSRILACAHEAGIRTFQVPAHYITQTCPHCGYVSADNVDLKRRKIKCGKCGRAEHIDIAAAANVLARGEVMRHGDAKDLKELTPYDGAAKRTARKPASKGPKSRSSKEGSGKR